MVLHANIITIAFITCVSRAEARLSYRLDVRLSVCLSHAGIVSKRLSSNCLHGLVAHDSSFLRSKLFPGIPMGTPLTGALNARGRKKLQFPTNISL